jgi:hypothetical protein
MRVHDLDRDPALEPQIVPQIHHGHSAAGDA